MRFDVVLALSTMVACLTQASFRDGGSANYTLVKLHDFTEALCLDGSPGAFYFRPGRPGDDGEAPRDFMIYFEGGGWCYTPEQCLERSNSTLGSSKSYPDSVSPDHYGGGMINADCSENPAFCNFNLIYMRYCDGASFAGSRESALVVGNTSLYFRGRAIREAVLEYAAANLNLTMARRVLLTGCSAGGLATFLHMDTVASWLQQKAVQLEQYGAFPVSGFFLAHVNTLYQPGYIEQMRGIFNMSHAWNGGLDAGCLARFDAAHQWRCMFAEFTFAFTKTPTFVSNSKTDAWQIPCILTVNTTSAECYGTPGYRHCNHSWPFTKNCFDTSNAAPVLAYETDFQSRVDEVAGFWAPRSGFLIDSCYLHCEAQSTSAWLKTRIGDISLGSAVADWWAKLAVEAPQTPVRLSDCSWTDAPLINATRRARNTPVFTYDAD